ncbi:MAG: hypothetical protein DMG62_18245 [Acidobacteria bacterium]|nr:MAG: hypothetical protein DMG62_18245 [Acidobacteriota bacterium]
MVLLPFTMADFLSLRDLSDFLAAGLRWPDQKLARRSLRISALERLHLVVVQSNRIQFTR